MLLLLSNAKLLLTPPLRSCSSSRRLLLSRPLRELPRRLLLPRPFRLELSRPFRLLS